VLRRVLDIQPFAFLYDISSIVGRGVWAYRKRPLQDVQHTSEHNSVKKFEFLIMRFRRLQEPNIALIFVEDPRLANFSA
jgi:hypothetical protein